VLRVTVDLIAANESSNNDSLHTQVRLLISERYWKRKSWPKEICYKIHVTMSTTS